MRVILFLFFGLLSLFFLIPKGETNPVKYTSNSQISDFSVVDAHAKASSPSDEKDVTALSSYLLKGASTDIEKVRTIYIWLTDNILYNAVAYNSGNFPIQDASAVLKSRKAVCEGFSDLFLALSEKMDLEAHKIVGLAKGYSFSQGRFNYSKSNHAWNTVKIDGKWKLFDATWGAGYGEEAGNQMKNVKEFNNFWFDTAPYSFYFSHFPEELKWTLLPSQFNINRFKKLPYIQEPFFELGFDGKKIMDLFLKNPRLELVQTFKIENDVHLDEVPVNNKLSAKKNYRLKIFSPESEKMAMIENNGKNWKFFKKEGNYFKLNYQPTKKGNVKVAIQDANNIKKYNTILAYKIVK